MTARRSQFCTGGHDRTLPGATYSDGQCRECKRQYNLVRDKVRVRGRRSDECDRADSPVRTDQLLALWKQLETAMPFERTDIRREIAALMQA